MPMHVLIIAGHAPSLVHFRAPFMNALMEAGHQVTALAPPEGESALDTERGMAALGVPLLRYPLDRGGLNPARDLGTLLALRRRFLDLGPDLALAYTIKPVIYASLAARLAGGPRMASMITGLGYGFGALPGHPRSPGRVLLTGLVTGLCRLALKRNSVVIFQNPDDLELFQRLGIVSPEQNTALVAGSGVDLIRFAPAPPVMAHPQTGGPVFLCVARLLWAKGVGVYAEACRMLKRRYPEAVCRLVGPCDAVPDAVPPETIRRWKADGVLEILDPVDDVRPLLAEASVFVLPSYREGTPRSSLEAMAMGRPVITTDVPGCRQTVEDGLTGLLAPPFEPGALMRAMERFILEPELIDQMGRAARRLAEERFDARQVARDMLAALPLGQGDPVFGEGL